MTLLGLVDDSVIRDDLRRGNRVRSATREPHDVPTRYNVDCRISIVGGSEPVADLPLR